MFITKFSLNHLIEDVDKALRVLWPQTPRASARPSPANGIKEATLAPEERRHVAGLMRVNHVGEVCAQALYLGHAKTLNEAALKAHMLDAAKEEVDHMAWCEQRLAELEGAPSKMNAFWYGGAYILGLVAGRISPDFALGFVAETERQVGAHLSSHLQDLPKQDRKTEAILKEMASDEQAHCVEALKAGAKELPLVLKKTMALFAKCMTTVSYYI